MALGVYLQTALLDLPSLLYRAIKVSNPAEFRHHLSRENGGPKHLGSPVQEAYSHVTLKSLVTISR